MEIKRYWRFDLLPLGLDSFHNPNKNTHQFCNRTIAQFCCHVPVNSITTTSLPTNIACQLEFYVRVPLQFWQKKTFPATKWWQTAEKCQHRTNNKTEVGESMVQYRPRATNGWRSPLQWGTPSTTVELELSIFAAPTDSTRVLDFKFQ